MSTITNITEWLIGIAGIFCAFSIVMSAIKIMTGDEGESKQYLKRIKNSIIAIILILSVFTIKSLVVDNYFSPSSSEFGIGNFNNIEIGIVGSVVTDNGNSDKQKRQMIAVDGQLYVRTDSNKNITLDGKLKIKADIYKQYEACQGNLSGWGQEDEYYIVRKVRNKVSSSVSDKSQGFLISSSLYCDDAEDWEDIIGNYDYKNRVTNGYQIATNSNGTLREPDKDGNYSTNLNDYKWDKD